MISNSKLKYNYTVRTDKIKDEDGEIHTVYGINLYVGNALIKEIPDIFFAPKVQTSLFSFATSLN